MIFEQFRRTERVESTVQKQQDNITKETAITRQDKKKPFAYGRYSNVHETKAYISNDPEERKVALVVKKYTEGPHFDSNDFEIDATAQNAYEKYQMAKTAGLQVPATYRLDAANNSIVMTNYNNEGGVAFGLNPNMKTEGLISNTRIIDISNFEMLIEELREQCALAADNQIKLSTDSFFLLFPRRGGRADADFVIADFDHVEHYQEERQKLYERNLKFVRAFLYKVIRENGTEELFQKFEQAKRVLH